MLENTSMLLIILDLKYRYRVQVAIDAEKREIMFIPIFTINMFRER